MPMGKHPVFLVEGKKLWLYDAEQLPDVLKKRKLLLWVVVGIWICGQKDNEKF
jgi:hypothetical protein